MYSNTEPSGEAIHNLANNPPYYAFDKNINTKTYNGGTSVGKFIGYDFKTQIVVKKVEITATNDPHAYLARSITIQGSNDGDTYTDIYTHTFKSVSTAQKFVLNISNNTKYKIYRVVCNEGWFINTAEGYYFQVAELQFYGR